MRAASAPQICPAKGLRMSGSKLVYICVYMHMRKVAEISTFRGLIRLQRLVHAPRTTGVVQMSKDGLALQIWERMRGVALRVSRLCGIGLRQLFESAVAEHPSELRQSDAIRLPH